MCRHGFPCWNFLWVDGCVLGICGHKDGVQVAYWDAVIERWTVGMCEEIGRYREGCGLMRLRE